MERKELEAAVSSNAHLRGLFAIPLGLLMVLAALGNWELGPLRHAGFFIACALALAATCLLIARYYNEHYGHATPSTKQQARSLVSVLVAVPLVIGTSQLLSSKASWSLHLPVNTVAITLALVMLMTYALSVGVRPHHLVVFGSLFAAGVLPVWTRDGMGDSSNIGLVLAGVAVIVAGLLDHRLLVRTVGPPEGLRVEGADAGA